jgi:serine/threonine protein kinase
MMSTVQVPNKETTISRFRVQRVLGQGGEGVVYLAADPKLGRQVAIKTLSIGQNQDPALANQLLGAARTVSTLSHPNIVPVFEVGMDDGQPFVVFEYVEGRTLAALLESNGALPMARAVVMMSQILGGVAQVHASGMLHGDLKPANILIGANGIPRVTDFGLSRHAHQAINESVSKGTIRYMAPECFRDGRTDCRGDVYALGLIFYEMLTGEPMVGGRNVYAQIHRILNTPAEAPSAKCSRIDPQLDAFVLKALEKDPQNRFADAAEMKRSLDRFRVSGGTQDEVMLQDQPVHSTVEFLLRRMALKSDFPALSASFARINRACAQADRASLKSLAEAIMRDFGLTQKLLRVVNSAAFGAGKITKVSQAITVLGIAQLRAIAAGMLLANGARSGTRTPEVDVALTDAFVTGIIARNVGRALGLDAAEELFICGMFSRLGQLLTLYYLSEENAEIVRRIGQENVDPAAASRAVLGLSFEQLGVAVARKWHFPDGIVNAMVPLATGPLAPPETADQRTWYCAGYARELCDVMRTAKSGEHQMAVFKHIDRFADSVPLDFAHVQGLIEHSLAAALKFAAASGLAHTDTRLLQGFSTLRRQGPSTMAESLASESSGTLTA